jgi:hypothetical protein
MTSINITSILYLAFRLAPFIIVGVFSFSSIIHQDFKGLIYLGGLLFTCFIAIVVGNTIPDRILQLSGDNKDGSDSLFETKVRICNLISLTDAGPLSKIPLNITIFSFTFFYLLYIIVHHDLVNRNIPTIIIFTMLILTELLWNMKNNCANFITLGIGFIIGSLCGLLWSVLIDRSGMTNLKYYNGISTQVTCSRPSEQKFKCSLNAATS